VFRIHIHYNRILVFCLIHTVAESGSNQDLDPDPD